MLLALDLSTERTGYAIFDFDGKLHDLGHITPPGKLSVNRRVQRVVYHIREFYPGITEVAIEDVFLGKNVRSLKELCRLSGAVIYSWMYTMDKEPWMCMAVHARKLLKIDPSARKSDIQLYVLKRFFSKKSESMSKLEQIRESIFREYLSRKMTKNKLEKELEQLIKIIEKETEISDDMADAIVVGLAYLITHKKIKG
jgi:Holliday junction resolvasome RuvABC endonuclease subunit